MEEVLTELLHIGSHVLVHSLVSNTHLNQKYGCVIGKEDGHCGVVMLEDHCHSTVRKVWIIKPGNLEPLSSHKGFITPVEDLKVKSASINLQVLVSLKNI